MAPPLEIITAPVATNVDARRDDYRHRRQSRATMRKRRLQTHWKPYTDILWQKNPDRVLKYRPSHLHYYGWIPFAVLRNWKATVFSEVYLHVQCLILLAWMLTIHVWGLGVPDQDLATLVIMIGNPFLGGIFNFGMIVTFILGLFMTLVINRWWTIRAAYTKLMGTTTDLCMTVASAIQNAEDPNDRRIIRARTELTRLLNLGHLLVIGKADALNQEFRKAYGLRTLYRHICTKIKDIFHAATQSSRASQQSGSPVYTQALFKPRNLLTFDTMVSEGLMNRDEWEILNEGERDGLPEFHLVYYWTQALINKCRAAEWILQAQQTVPTMLNKINTIVESGSSIITTINSQMPYPYVHLVSLVVHIYLIVLSTWFGCFLHTGRLGEKFVLENGNVIKKDTDDIQTSVWMMFWCYLLMIVANTIFQGLLHLHTLLDNPFGNHCTKFPLRANVSNVTNSTRTMLTLCDKFPAAFEDIFHPELNGVESVASTGGLRTGPDFADFLNPSPTGQLPLQSMGSPRHVVDRFTRRSAQPRLVFISLALFSELQSTAAVEGHEIGGVALTPTRRRHSFDVTSTSQEPTRNAPAVTNLDRLATGATPAVNEGQIPENVEFVHGASRSSGDVIIQQRFLQSAERETMTTTDGRDTTRQPSSSAGAPNRL